MKFREVKIRTMLDSAQPLDWLRGDAEFSREFLVVALCSCFLVDLQHCHSAFPSLIPQLW